MTEKTYKREVAVVMLAMYFGAQITGLWYPMALGFAEAVKSEVFLFAGGAFAMDAYAKQVQK